MATRSSLSILLDDILAMTRNASYAVSRALRVTPAGNYSGYSNYSVSQNSPVVTNPWSIGAYVRSPRKDWEYFRPNPYALQNPRIYLAPGQSYNFATGQYNDPTIHNKTAARLNQQVNEMKANEAGLVQASETSVRGKKSILATVDELYWGDVRTKANQGTALSLQKQAQQGGINTTGTRTILGEKPAAPTPVVSKRRYM